MKRTKYVVPLTEGVQYRVEFEQEHGLILSFVVQLEVAINDHWEPVVRYDTAHGFAHCDEYRPDGTVRKHQPMAVSDYNEGLTSAAKAVRAQGKRLAQAFREGRQ